MAHVKLCPIFGDIFRMWRVFFIYPIRLENFCIFAGASTVVNFVRIQLTRASTAGFAAHVGFFKNLYIFIYQFMRRADDHSPTPL